MLYKQEEKKGRTIKTSTKEGKKTRKPVTDGI